LLASELNYKYKYIQKKLDFPFWEIRPLYLNEKVKIPINFRKTHNPKPIATFTGMQPYKNAISYPHML